MVEKGCVYIIKCALGYDWERLRALEREALPERRWVVGRVAFTREDAVAESRAEGKAAGIEEGKAAGIEEGKAVGIAEGIEQGRSQIALAMLKEGDPDAKICRITGLSRKELALLKRSLPK